MMRSFFALLAFVFAFVLAPSALAYTPPPMTAHVTDTAHKLTEPERLAIDAKLEAYRLRSGNEIAVFVPDSLGGDDIETVAFTTFRTWRLGVAGKDNGVLLVIAPVERKARIQTGKGVEGALPDLKANDIIRQQIRPRLAVGNENYRAAIDGATDAIIASLDSGGVSSAPASSPSTHHDASPLAILFAIVFFCLMIGVPLLFIIALGRIFGRAFSSNGRSANRGWVSGSSYSNDSSWSSSSSSDSSWSSGGGGDSGFSGGGGDTGGGGSSDSF